MILYPISRFVAVAAYLLIFLYGELFQAPMILWIIAGIFGGYQLPFILAGLAVIALSFLMVVEQRKATIVIECLAFVFMLLPVINAFTSAPSIMLRYDRFIIPACLFLLLFPLSIVLSYRKYRRSLHMM